ncbi:MAG TPA: hypothetical protein V6C82_04500, partial [Chroococcales cyanobacterium]
MKGRFWGLLLLVLAAWLQIGGLNALLPFRLDFILLVVVCFGVLRGPREGLIFGLLAGSLEGGLTGSFYFLAFMMAKAVVGFLAGKLRPFLYHHGGGVIMAMVAVSTLLQETLLGLCFITTGLAVGAHLNRYLIPLILIHSLAAPFLFKA